MAVLEQAIKRPSEKSYGTAVALSGTLGYFGVQHFYLGRHAEGFIDVALTVLWIYFFATDQFLYGFLCLAADLIHSFVTTILLLTGSFRDGEGHIVCYPGQKL